MRTALRSRWTVALGIALCAGIWALLWTSRPENEPRAASLGDQPATASEADETLVSPMGNRSVSPPTSPPPTPSGSAENPEEGLRLIAAVGARLDHALDLVTPTPDLSLLLELRALVERHDLSTAELIEATANFEFGDPRGRALTLASAWGRGADESTDQRLSDLGRYWMAGDTPAEQHALAAVWALDLGERSEALSGLARDLVELGFDGSSGELNFEGLAGIRAWFALRAIDAAELESWDPVFERAEGSGRVARELWALAARSDPRRRGRAALDAATSGDDAARSGVEVLGPAFQPELSSLALEPAALSPQPWLPSSALKALVGSASPESLSVLQRALSSPLDKRQEALEALRTWRAPRDPHRQVEALLRLRADLDDEARSALDRGLARTLDATLIRQLDPAAHAELTATLAEHRGAIGDETELGTCFDLWLDR